MNLRYRMWIAMVAALVGLLMPLAASAQDSEESDDRARVSFVRPLIDAEGQLWFKVGFFTPWDDKPPRDLFSFFAFLDVSVDGEGSSIGWQVHDGEENAIYDGAATEDPQAFITEDGCMLVATGLFPDPSATVTVNAAWGSWIDESSTQTIFGGDEFAVDLADAESGDPFAVLGQPVFDLTSGEMITVSTTAPPTSSTAAPTTTASSTAASTTATTAPTTVTTVGTTTATTGVVAITEGGDPWFLWSLFILLFFGLLAWLMIFFFQWWVPPFMGPWVRRYGRTVTEGLDESPDEDGEERKTTPDEDTETGGTDTTGTDTTDTDTTGTDESETTRDTREGGGVGTGPDPAPDRQPTKLDCTPLRVECERLRADATRLELEANDARSQANQAADDCEQADTRVANLEAKIADLNARENAPQRYQRLAEAQIDLRAAQATFAAVCAASDALETAAATAEASAAASNAAADAACQAADECEAGGG